MTSRSPPIPCEVPQDDRNDAEVEAEVPIASAAEDGNEILSTEAKSRPHLVELFIGDLSYFCTEEDIQKLFSRYGTVVETRIRRSDRGGHSLMFGFVKMTSLEDAERCECELDNLSFMGRLLRVQVCSLSGASMTKPPRPGVHVHVSFVSNQNTNLVTEASIREIFDHYGEVTDVIIKRHVKAEDHQTGYGFVYFATYEQAESVIATVHNTVIDGIKFDCAWSKQPSDHSEGNGASAYPQVKRVKPLTPTNSNKANKRPGFHQFRSDQRGRDMPPPLVLPHASSAGSQQVQYRSRQPTTLQFRQEPSFMPPPRGGGHFRSYMNVDTINDSKSQRQFDRDPYPSQPLSSQQQARPPQPATSTGPPSMSSLPYWQNSHHQPTTNPQPTYAMYSPNLASSTVHMNVSWSNNNHLPPPPAPNSNLVYNQVHEHPNQSMMYYHGSQIAPYYSPPRHHHITYNTQQSSPPSMYPPHDNQNVSYAYNNMPPPPANNHNPSDYNHSQFYHNPSEYR